MKKKTFLVAEVGLAHDGSLGIAKSFVDKISSAGADAVKFQIHDYYSESSKYEKFRKKFSYQDKDRSAYWKRTKFTKLEWKHLIDYTSKQKIKFIVSPFSIESFELLKSFNVYAWKIASGEFTNLPLIEHIVKNSKKPLILSTGLTYDKEIKVVLKLLSKIKNKITLLQCNSIYPCPVEKVGHNMIQNFSKKYKVDVGISDHSGKKNSIIAGITYKADMIETHVAFDRKFFGPDSSSSITFDELKEICEFNKDFNKIAAGKINKSILTNNQKRMRKIFCKSIALKKNVNKNTLLTLNNIKFVKPQKGVDVFEYKKVLGKKIKRKKIKDEFLKWNDLK